MKEKSTYHVWTQTTSTTVYEVVAESEEDAKENFDEGKVIHNKLDDFDIFDVERGE